MEKRITSSKAAGITGGEKIAHNKALFLEALGQRNGLINAASVFTKIPYRTHKNWYDADPEYKDQIDQILETQLDKVESALLKRISSEDTTAIIFYLKCKGKGRGYIERQELDLGAGTKVTINFGDGDKDIG